MRLLNNMKEIPLRMLQDIKQYRWIIIAFALWNIIVRAVFHAFCPILIFFGVPCAGCGMTRAICFILTGQLERGMRLNPAAPLWICFVGYVIWMRYFLGRKVKGIYLLLSLIVTVTLLIYVYRMITAFPGNPPLVFHYNCILEKMFPGYIRKLKAWIG